MREELPERPEADPVFGHVAPPDADADDTRPTQEILRLFDQQPSELPYQATELSRSDRPGTSGKGRWYGPLAGAAALVAVTVGVAGGYIPGGGSEPGAEAGPADTVQVTDPATSASPTPTTRESRRANRSSERPTSPAATPTTPQTGTSTGTSTSTGTLRRGDSGEQVVELQLRLRQLQLLVAPANGTYGPATEAAVTRFQQARNIGEEPGAYGPKTRAAVEAETSGPE
ncbi:peptidoglycan-binding domain-containing protein [Streptomyces sp. B-S-A8]|uniref:Peptidoglycan-binding domain-containing protein n=1 Tax=Streptomyces solicavernae TaxID=3043614 RepID=A0ABT6RL48_9ACTN|nr:peptidoglycan-binding domain-containing protein [Streptomyces sp. B-S-A8]MDI3385147.1 peptidoglycan-binding domain-containing protein [Streptomyces sp. B-S-A8]